LNEESGTKNANSPPLRRKGQPRVFRSDEELRARQKEYNRRSYLRKKEREARIRQDARAGEPAGNRHGRPRSSLSAKWHKLLLAADEQLFRYGPRRALALLEGARPSPSSVRTVGAREYIRVLRGIIERRLAAEETEDG
jgi:hypothetical protein